VTLALLPRRWHLANGVEVELDRGHLVFDTILGAIDAAENGHGVMLAMDPLVRSHPSYGTRLVMTLSGTSSESQSYNFLCKEAQWSSPKIQKAYRWLQDCLADLRGS